MTSRPRNGRMSRPEDARGKQENANEVDDQRAEDQQGIGTPRHIGEPGVHTGGEPVKLVPHAGFRHPAGAEERLGPEPEPQRGGHRQDPEHRLARDRFEPSRPGRWWARSSWSSCSGLSAGPGPPGVKAEHGLESRPYFGHQVRRRMVAPASPRWARRPGW